MTCPNRYLALAGKPVKYHYTVVIIVVNCVVACSSRDTRVAPGKAAVQAAPQAAREDLQSGKRDREGQRMHSRCAPLPLNIAHHVHCLIVSLVNTFHGLLECLKHQVEYHVSVNILFGILRICLCLHLPCRA